MASRSPRLACGRLSPCITVIGNSSASLYTFRAQKPHLLRAWESYVLIRAGNFMPVEEHNSLLEESLEQLSQRSGKPRDSIRVVVEGAFCEQPPLDLIKLVEDAGCYLVDDDFVIGQSWFVEDVPVDRRSVCTRWRTAMSIAPCTLRCATIFVRPVGKVWQTR